MRLGQAKKRLSGHNVRVMNGVLVLVAYDVERRRSYHVEPTFGAWREFAWVYHAPYELLIRSYYPRADNNERAALARWARKNIGDTIADQIMASH